MSTWHRLTPNPSVARGELALDALRFLGRIESGNENRDPESADYGDKNAARPLTPPEKRMRDAALSCLTELFNSEQVNLDVVPDRLEPPTNGAATPVPSA